MIVRELMEALAAFPETATVLYADPPRYSAKDDIVSIGPTSGDRCEACGELLEDHYCEPDLCRFQRRGTRRRPA